jgi:hypothetical protein
MEVLNTQDLTPSIFGKWEFSFGLCNWRKGAAIAAISQKHCSRETARPRERLTLQGETMSDARYYLVGENDVWMVQLRDCRHSDGASRNEAVAFAIDAAQKLGMQGESAHVCEIDDHGRFRYKWTYNRDHRPSRRYLTRVEAGAADLC